MTIQDSLRGRHPRYHAELRLFITSTSYDIGPERSSLLSTVLPEFRKRSGERGVIVVENDPRWEISLAPSKSQEIFAARMSELHGYRPVFIGILGNGSWSAARNSRSNLPWLRDIRAGNDRSVAMDFIERVLDNQLMRERAFFYILDAPDGGGPEAERPSDTKRFAELCERARNGQFIVRAGITDIATLGKHILNDLLAALDQLHPSEERLTLLEQVRRPHSLLAARLRRTYQEIPQYFDKLDDHIAGNGPPLVITGRSGDGKSALVANWMEYARVLKPDMPIICHHIGAASAQTDHDTVLRHVMAELKEICAISDPLPESTESLTSAFPRWLEQVANERLVLIIDGLDQIDSATPGLEWLPAEVNRFTNVRLIVSTVHEGEAGEIITGTLADRGWKDLRVKPLTVKQRQSIIDRLVAETGEDLGRDLRKRFRLGGDISSPLFIRMGAGHIRNTRTEKDRNILLDAASAEEFLERMFENLEETFGRLFLRETMAFLWGARRGLLESELLQLTKGNPELLNRFLASADHYLVEQDGRWAFIHKRIRDAVEQRYLPDAASRKRMHRRLAGYFASQPITFRRADEEPWHLERAAERRKLAQCLADIALFMRLSVDDRRHELLGYWVRLNDEKLLARSYEQSFAAWCAINPERQEQGAVAERLGTFFTASGLLAIAERYLRLALHLYRESLGYRHLETAHAIHNLAELLRQTGGFAEAEELYHAALSIREQQLEPDHPLIAQILSDIALLYRDWGMHRSALPYYQRALDLKERIHGGDHPTTAEVLNDLALFYHDLEEFATAIPLYVRALDIGERHLGPKHPLVATTLSNLAGAYYATGDSERSEAHYRRALEIREEILGPVHPHTQITMANLASLLKMHSKYREAGKLFKRAIASTEQCLGAEHLNSVSLNIAYASFLGSSNDIVASETLFRKTLAIASRTLGNAHPLVGTCINNLATLLWKTEREAEAEMLFQRAIETWRVSLGPEHPNIAIALYSLARLRIGQGITASVPALLEEALTIREKNLGTDHDQTVAVRELLGQIR